MYELGSDAENLSDHENGFVFRRALDSERTIANGFSLTRKDGSAGKASKSNSGSASNALLPPSSESDGGDRGALAKATYVNSYRGGSLLYTNPPGVSLNRLELKRQMRFFFLRKDLLRLAKKCFGENL
jgi:hypothetical protein